MQNQPSSSGSIIEPVSAQPFGPSAPGTTPPSTGTPLTSAAMGVPQFDQKSHRNVIETVILVVVSIIAVVFICLYINKYIEWDTVSTDIDGQIDVAVAAARAEVTTELEAEFAEREKYDYKSFLGPADYGSVGFEYPRTWSVYIAKDASNGGDFEAYMNPREVEPIGPRTINALRLTIRDVAFDNVIRTYDNYVKNGRLQLVNRNVGGVLANVYTGQLPNDIQGILVAFKLRDKTVLLQTDAEIFANEFYKLLDTVTVIE